MTAQTRNWFDRGGGAYAAFRPDYPPALAHWLASIAPDRTLAVDVGCGSGQLTVALADHFDAVIGVDPSADQLAHANRRANIDYRQGPAETLPVDPASASLVTAAQAAHWFDLPAFFAEARRIARPNAVLALISYGVPEFADARLQARFEHFYWQEIGAWWPAERHLVHTRYAGIDFPFARIAPPALAIECRWNLEEWLGYVSTWSAMRRAAEMGQMRIAEQFAADHAALWGDPADRHAVAWPITILAGRIDAPA